MYDDIAVCNEQLIIFKVKKSMASCKVKNVAARTCACVLLGRRLYGGSRDACSRCGRVCLGEEG